MPVLLRNLTFNVTKIEQTLFTPTSYPRLFGGKIDLANLVSGDILKLRQETKYDSGDSFGTDRERSFTNETLDKTARITPVREDDEITWIIVLDAASPSANVNVKVLIWDETVI